MRLSQRATRKRGGQYACCGGELLQQRAKLPIGQFMSRALFHNLSSARRGQGMSRVFFAHASGRVGLLQQRAKRPVGWWRVGGSGVVVGRRGVVPRSEFDPPCPPTLTIRLNLRLETYLASIS